MTAVKDRRGRTSPRSVRLALAGATAVLAMIAGVVAADAVFPVPTMWRVTVNVLVLALAVHPIRAIVRRGSRPVIAADHAVGSTTYGDVMSKVDAMQAMREARFAARTTKKSLTVAKPAAATPGRKMVDESAGPVPTTALPADQPGSAAALDRSVMPLPDAGADPPEALCGHRSMNNRLCRRPAGHPEKNHRYQ